MRPKNRKLQLRLCFGYRTAILATVFVLVAAPARASIALLMEEPYGEFGAFNPTGHAAVYLSHVCAETPTQLRPCVPGEFGVVISRYHKIDGYDWIAIPLIPYLYAVDDASQVPASVDRAQVKALRNAYRRDHLEALAPDTRRGHPPRGEWTQLVGSSYDRTIHGFAFASTAQQDDRFIALFNDRRDVGHFNLLFHNCADFSRNVIGMYMPGAVHRNFIADVGLTTPKQVARSLVKYGRSHPDAQMFAFVITQVAGSLPRSHPVDGVAESLIKSKKYLIPLAVLNPELTAGVIVAYLADGRLSLPKDAPVFDAGAFASGEEPTPPATTGTRQELVPPAPADPPAQSIAPITSDGAALSAEPSPGTASRGSSSLMR